MLWENAQMSGNLSLQHQHFKLHSDAKTMVKWYRGEIRFVPKRDENGRIVEEECVDERGRVQKITVFTNQVQFEDIGIIKKLANEAQRLRESSHLGARFNDRTFSNFDQKQDELAFKQCLAYAQRENLFTEEKNGLLILGTVGTGKTHLAASIANYLVEKGIPTQFGTFIDYLESIKREYDAIGQKEELSRLKNTLMLVIDDLGKEKWSEWTQQVLFDIVNHRYEYRLPIVVTSNLNPDQLKKYVGEAIYSRLYEMCGYVRMTGANYRQR